MKQGTTQITTTKATADPITYDATVIHKGSEVAWVHGSEGESRKSIKTKAENYIKENGLTCADCGALINHCWCKA